ncbi:MAG TPA: ATP-binding cassette domain-containing protein [Bacteroidales bacterium]|nr:ATP-binding cassette domain-containing protein [Bacteroidales bacterium]
MRINFSNLVPSPLLETNYNDSEVWGRDFSVSGTQKVLVSAASGKGKTTLLNIIIGRRSDYVGSVSIDGQSPLEMSGFEKSILLSRKISMVHQGLALFDELSLWDNIILKNRITKHRNNSEIMQMLQRLQLTEQINQKVKTLSFGQKQRTAIVRALCQPFEFLLLDEPFSHLDDQNARLAWDLIAEELNVHAAGLIITSLGNRHAMSYDEVYNL